MDDEESEHLTAVTSKLNSKDLRGSFGNVGVLLGQDAAL